MKNLFFLIPIMLLLSCKSKPEAVSVPESGTNVEADQIVTFTQAQMKNASIETGVPQERNLFSTVRVNGVVDVPPQNLISVSFPLGGYLYSTELLPGMRITKGQVIAVMEDQSYITLQEDYLVAVARLEMISKEFDRQKVLNASKSSSDKVFEQAQSDFATQKITVSALKQKLMLIGIQAEKLTAETISRKVNVYSPINGYVSQVNVNIGSYLAPSDVMFELVNPADLHIALTVFEKDLPFIQVGQKVRVHMTADPEKTFEAEVILVGKKMDENRTTQVHCHFEGAPTELIPGMFVNAEIEVTKSNSLSVPEAAVVQLRESEFVFVQQANMQFRMVKVTTGISQDGWVELTSDPEDVKGKTLITNNAWSALMMLENKAE